MNNFINKHRMWSKTDSINPCSCGMHHWEKKWVNLTHFITLTLVPKNTHIDESSWFTFFSQWWVYFSYIPNHFTR